MQRNASPVVDPPAVNEGQGGYPNRSGLNHAATILALGCSALPIFAHIQAKVSCVPLLTCFRVIQLASVLPRCQHDQVYTSDVVLRPASLLVRKLLHNASARLPKSLFAQFQRVDGTSDASKTHVTAL